MPSTANSEISGVSLPLPFGTQIAFVDQLRLRFGRVTVCPGGDLNGVGEERRRHEAFRAAARDMQLEWLTTRRAGFAQRRQHDFRPSPAYWHRHQTTGIERIADLAIQRSQNGVAQRFVVGMARNDDPCAAGAVQADRRAGAARQGAQGVHRRAGTARHGERQASIQK